MTSTFERPLEGQVRELLLRALDLPPEERTAFVRQHLPPGEALEEARGLLAEVEDLGGFLEGRAGIDPDTFRPPLPRRVGGYRVQRVLGWGSMGVVYLAEQDAPRRLVALKVLRFDVSSEDALRRFEHEGQVLAHLSHPGIAAVFEAGVAALGAGRQPFLVMEYVDGKPITTYAKQEGLDVHARVELVVAAARAIEHAHERGVLHRDLKPENILVSPRGETTVLDFGVARATWDDADLLTLTATGQVVGTIAYMAPEQARGARVDERADQFALGVILYELLTGRLPFDVRGRLPHEALRAVADANWEPPTVHAPELAGDLEAILATALAAEPARRYASVGAFADDLERWRTGRPVEARVPSMLETLARFVRRNKRLSATVVTVLLALGAGILWGTQALFELRREGAVSLLFSDRQLLARLQAEAMELWPTSTATVPAFEDWLGRASGLTERMPQHRAAFARLRRGAGGETATGAALGEEWLLVEGERFLHDAAEFEHGLLEEVTGRARVAADLHEATVVRHLDAWREAADRVRSDGRFDGLELMPQEGLVPLGQDPASGLEEFALWGSGTLPVRSASGAIAPRSEDALVLVLVPGGDVWIGAQSGDPERRNYAARAKAHEGPPVRIRLDPFLIGKHEITQGQWTRLFGFNPSDWEIGARVEGKTVDARHPVESLSWEQLVEYLPRVGLTLPTEAQWERAARGGSSWARVYGSDLVDLDGRGNWNVHTRTAQAGELALRDDGYVYHMPVGSFPPNGYGLHDVLGNVWELCLDDYKVDYHELAHQEGDGRVEAEPDGDVSRRGQSSMIQPVALHVYVRDARRFDGRDAETGARPARRLLVENPGDSRHGPRGPND